MWIFLALMSALLTGASAVVSKIGLKNVDSGVGFAVQSVVILVLSCGYAGVSGKARELSNLHLKDWAYLLAAGGVTTLAYQFYFAAVKAGDVSRVAPVDRLSLVFSVALAAVFLKEKVTAPVIFGATLMVIGALVIAASGSKAG